MVITKLFLAHLANLGQGMLIWWNTRMVRTNFSSLHWLILGFLYALCIQWSVLATIKTLSFKHSKSNCIVAQRCIFAQRERVKYSPRTKKCNCQTWKCVVSIKGLQKQTKKKKKLSISIASFLTNYDVTNRKLQYDLIYSSVRKRTIWERNNPMETTILRLRRAIMVIVVTIVRIAKHLKIIKLILDEKKNYLS